MTEETKSLEPWKPQDFTDKVEKKIREVFVDLIPEEVFHKMVADALESFTTGKTVTVEGHHEGKYYNKRTDVHYPSGMQSLVNKILEQSVRDALVTRLASAEWTKTWDGIIGDKLQEAIKEAAPVMFEGMVGGMLARVIESMKHNSQY